MVSLVNVFTHHPGGIQNSFFPSPISTFSPLAELKKMMRSFPSTNLIWAKPVNDSPLGGLRSRKLVRRERQFHFAAFTARTGYHMNRGTFRAIRISLRIGQKLQTMIVACKRKVNLGAGGMNDFFERVDLCLIFRCTQIFRIKRVHKPIDDVGIFVAIREIVDRLCFIIPHRIPPVLTHRIPGMMLDKNSPRNAPTTAECASSLPKL